MIIFWCLSRETLFPSLPPSNVHTSNIHKTKDACWSTRFQETLIVALSIRKCFKKGCPQTWRCPNAEWQLAPGFTNADIANNNSFASRTFMFFLPGGSNSLVLHYHVLKWTQMRYSKRYLFDTSLLSARCFTVSWNFRPLMWYIVFISNLKFASNHMWLWSFWLYIVWLYNSHQLTIIYDQTCSFYRKQGTRKILQISVLERPFRA